ncbi:MAG: glycosyl hydrolase [Bacteroidales bacterium]
MKRREFISGGAVAAAGWMATGRLNIYAGSPVPGKTIAGKSGIYELFRNPSSDCRPFVRWWWNGNKVEPGELVRELRLLRAAGIGGVEINPVQFPFRFPGDDLGKPSLVWLSREWVKMLQVVFDEAKTLGITCDLIVGSGWPFGSEDISEEERSRVVVVFIRKISGPIDFSVSRDEILAGADPAVSSPWPGRTSRLLSLVLVPDPLVKEDQIIDFTDRTESEYINLFIPEGNHAFYALVEITGFMEVINGSPGASGPVLDHFSEAAVREYLERMSVAIEAGTGPLWKHLRALFTDSMELEGANWTPDMRSEFLRRRGYDIFPFLPFILFRTGAMGNVTDQVYGVSFSRDFEEMTRRMRYDFETTKAELLEERFLKTFAAWCSDLGVRSRMQAYGRGFFPLESSMAVDIPEGESWTMNWLKHRIGEEMPENDYRRGRAYTMINKYVSSAAHLSGKRLISCEEMTDTYTVFNTSLENLKIGSDQSIISGITHSVFHGFNYSPPDAPYPGWIRYGAWYNEKNNWWPHFHLLNEYKGRLSALLQQCDMYGDIAILPPVTDMWSLIGMQNEPFPSVLHADYLSLIWEAMVKNGNGCDYVSERILNGSVIKGGYIHYGTRRYHTLFMVQVESLDPETAGKLLQFVRSGGRIFCIETIPSKSAGWFDHQNRDRETAVIIEKLKAYPRRFIFLKKPEKDFIWWYRTVQEQYGILPYLRIEPPDPFVMQTRFRADDGSEFIFIVNSHLHESRKTRVFFTKDVSGGKRCSVWDPESGKRFRANPDPEGGITLDLGPAGSLLFVFDHEHVKEEWLPLPVSGPDTRVITDGWRAEFRHCRDGLVKEVMMGRLTDLKEMEDFVNFSGTVIYHNSFITENQGGLAINLGKVHGTSELRINGMSCGLKWYGRRIWDITEFIRTGENLIEVEVTTSMGNYMKSLTDNPTAQYWTNEGRKIQPLQSMGMTGPVSYYKI